MTLTVARPRLGHEGSTTSHLMATKPILLVCGGVSFPDGAPLTADRAIVAGYLLYRQILAGVSQVWQEQQKRWLPETSEVEPQELFFKDGLWQSILVAVGQVDEAGHDKFSTMPATGYPQYFVRCIFEAKDAHEMTHSGISPGSSPVSVFSLSETERAGLSMSPKDPVQSTEIKLFLKDNALVERGQVVIHEQAGGIVVELLAGGASVMLKPNGAITLTPATGQPVRIDGRFEVQGEMYLNGEPVTP